MVRLRQTSPFSALTALSRNELYLAGLNWIARLGWTEDGWTELNGNVLSCVALRCTDLSWTRPNWTNCVDLYVTILGVVLTWKPSRRWLLTGLPLTALNWTCWTGLGWRVTELTMSRLNGTKREVVSTVQPDSAELAQLRCAELGWTEVIWLSWRVTELTTSRLHGTKRELVSTVQPDSAELAQ